LASSSSATAVDWLFGWPRSKTWAPKKVGKVGEVRIKSQ
jgi:hypothetical protein